jgi:hypothetical protein
MLSYFDKIQYLYPKIQGVSYWCTKYDGTAWEDLYDGVVWENAEIQKPIKEELDALDESVVEAELDRRSEELRKAERDEKYSKDLSLKMAYKNWEYNYTKNFSEFLDYIEQL